MNNTNIILPSSQIDSTLPDYIVEQYSQFVNFMTTAAESEERIGFGQDLLQNLQKYRDFDTYQNGIVKYGILAQNITPESEELVLEDGYGFPDENGVLYIDNEIILYRTKEGNTFYGLKRGSAGTTVLPTFTSSGTYVETCPKEHYAGVRVTNLSVLFLASMLETIYSSFAPNIDPSRVHSEVNQSSLLSNIRDFFQSKGTKLGIQSLFKMMFGDTGTDVSYPGDQIIIPSVSTYAEDLTCRVIPIPSSFYESNEIPENPGVLIGSLIQCKSYNDDIVYGESIVEYTKSYPFDQTIQYDLLLSGESLTGEILVNPSTFLTVELATNVYEIEVDSTNGFPDSGVLFIENEGILYTSKTDTRFLGCTRGYLGQEELHEVEVSVLGPYYIQGDYLFQPEPTTDKCDTRNATRVTSRSWPIGLISGTNITVPGVLHSKSDSIIIVDPISGALRSDIELDVSDVSIGDISDVFIQEPGSKRTSVGDFLYFDNTDTFGDGAAAKVSWVHGECVEESRGCEIVTNLISHRQQFDLSSYQDAYKFVFVPGQFLETSGSDQVSTAVVSSWNPETKVLIVQTTSPNLIVAGDSITDSRGNNITIAPDYIGVVPVTDNIFRGSDNYEISNLTILGYEKPTTRLNGDPLTNGDLWWSIQNGRLYIFYNGYWVTTQPYGTRPMGVYSSVVPIGVSGSDFVPTGNPPVKSQIIIADDYPTKNPDGSALRIGDLWWSSVTGLLYIWNSDTGYGGCITSQCDTNENVPQSSAEWVCTGPTGMLSWGPQGPQDQGPGPGSAPTNAVSFDTKVVISNFPPSNRPDGTLWWNSDRGRLFIRYQNTWVITNPFGSEAGPQSYYPDGTLDNSGSQSFDIGPIISLPELETQRELFFRNLCHFYPGDSVIFDNDVTATILEKNTNSLLLQRGPQSLPLVDGTMMRNTSRAKITLKTVEPHNLQIGDAVRFHSSVVDLNNKVFNVIDVGTAIPAEGVASLDGDSVSSVLLTYGGMNYDGDFYLTFVGGGGAGALAIARVENGVVNSVEMVFGGKNYTSIPEVRFNLERSVYFFTVYSDQWYPNPDILFYETTNQFVENYPTDVEVISGGNGYLSLPKVPGIYKREIDRASFVFTLNGTSIDTITVLNGGSRYVNPKAIILDANGKGTGGDVDLIVNDGVITSVVINDAGIDYENPFIVAIEEGVYLPETTNIGQIRSFKVIKEGRGVDPNELRTPIIYVETKLLLEYPVVDDCFVSTPVPIPTWNVGDTVYVGSTTAVITGWDPVNQLLSVNRIIGQIEDGDTITDNEGNTATVRISGQSLQNLTVSGASKVNGKFINDKSILNSNLSRVQDGEYYQLFSYVIKSARQRKQYENLVNDIIHPAGFVYFSNTKFEDSIVTQNRVDTPYISTGSTEISPIIFTGSDEPVNPRVGNLWFNSTTGTTYIYYGDRVSGQTYWVDTHQR